MTEYLTEEEQVELLKNWIKQYAPVIIAGVAMALIAVSGWRYWQERQERILTQASSSYDEMLSMRSQNDADATTLQAKKLTKEYPSTPYGKMGDFMLANHAIAQKDYATAEKNLKWVIKKADAPAFREIARIRLARVFIAAGKPKESIATLDKVDDKVFNGLIYEVRGDAYLAMHDTAKAREAYKTALADLPNAEVERPLLQMKYDNLTTTEVES